VSDALRIFRNEPEKYGWYEQNEAKEAQETKVDNFIKKALTTSANIGCGFEADSEDAKSILKLITDLESRITELELGLNNQMFHSAALQKIINKYQSRIAELKEAQRWRVDADVEFPEDDETVIVAFTEDPQDIIRLTSTYYKHFEGVDNWWDTGELFGTSITLWVPIPKLPGEA
jgi:hypothetical protein